MWVSHKKDWQGCQKFYLLFDWIVGIILANDYNFSKREYSAINSDGEPSVYLQKEWFLNSTLTDTSLTPTTLSTWKGM